MTTPPLITPIDATNLLWSLTVLLADHHNTDRHQLARDIGVLFEGILGEGTDQTVVADVVEAAPMLLDALDRHRPDSRQRRPRWPRGPRSIFTEMPRTSGESLHPGSPPARAATKPCRVEGSSWPAGHGLLLGPTACVSGVLGWLWGGRR